jgi:hypothetical protein
MQEGRSAQSILGVISHLLQGAGEKGREVPNEGNLGNNTEIIRRSFVKLPDRLSAYVQLYLLFFKPLHHNF